MTVDRDVQNDSGQLTINRMNKQNDMKTNDIFNFRRFGRYFTSDFRTCTANYGLSLITISLLSLIAMYVFTVGINLIFDGAWEGPDTGFRLFTFIVAMFCIVVTMPVKCYGKITEKQYGSTWLMIPASKLEKFLSMLIFTIIIAPVTGTVLFLGLDALICVIDPTCGQSLAGFFTSGWTIVRDLLEAGVTSDGIVLPAQGVAFMKKLMSPWVLFDEIPTMILPFVLGAIYFKSGKTVKTILTIAAFGMVSSIILTPLVVDWGSSIELAATGDPDLIMESLNNMSMFKHLALTDFISDTVTNIAIILGIWFRIKTLKH